MSHARVSSFIITELIIAFLNVVNVERYLKLEVEIALYVICNKVVKYACMRFHQKLGCFRKKKRSRLPHSRIAIVVCLSHG